MKITHPATLTATEEKALRQEWGTPPDLFAALDREFDFDIDVCASAENTKCAVWIDRDTDALRPGLSWLHSGAAFCNPGFQSPMPWIMKAHRESKRGGAVVVIGLTANSTDWWWYAAHHTAEIRLLRPRPQFVMPARLEAHLRAKKLPVSASNARENSVFVFKPRTPIGGARIYTWEWKKSIGGNVNGNGR